MHNKNVKWVGTRWTQLQYVGKNPIAKLWYFLFPPIPEMRIGKRDKHEVQKEVK